MKDGSLTIFQLVTSRKHRGAEVSAANLSAELIHRRHQVYFIGLFDPPDEPLCVDQAVHMDLGAKSTMWIDLKPLLKLRGLVKRYQPDIIQANGSSTLQYAVLACFAMRKPRIIYRNISMIGTWMGGSVFKRRIYSWLFNQVDHVVSVGDNAKRDFIQTLGISAAKVSVIRRGIPLSVYDSIQSMKFLQSRFDKPLQTKWLVHVGSFTPEKNHAFLLEVMKETLKGRNDIVLICLGDGSLRSALNKKIAEYQLEEFVFLPGLHKDLENWLPGADLMLLSSTVEGVPGVVLEAATFEIPTIAVDVGGISEVIEHGETGMLISEHDVQEYAGALLQLFDDASLLKSMGAKAQDFVKQHFAPSLTAETWIALYQSLL